MMTLQPPSELLTSVNRMSRDIRAAAATLSNREARYLVDAYYQMQEDRIRADHRIRTMDEGGEPNQVIAWLSGQSETLEAQIKGALDRFSRHHPAGEWARAQMGIGPVLASGFIAHIEDPLRFSSLGKLYAYAGVAPGKDRRVRGERMTFNPAVKRLMFLTGECFKRCSPEKEDAYYRHWYDKRKAYEVGKNEAGDYAEQAAQALAHKKFSPDTEAFKAYSAGKLPPGHIDRRACRWTAKLFLSHLHEVWWRKVTDKPYPALYCISHLGHMDHIPPPPG